MSKRTFRLVWIALAAAALLGVIAAIRWSFGTALPAQAANAKRPPRIRPDYTQIVIPPNIAPLNFLIEEPGADFRVRLHGAAGGSLLLGFHRPAVIIPQEPWRKLLEQNRGTNILLDVYVKGAAGGWTRFAPVENTVATEPIDSHLVYRLLGPICTLFRNMGIYQRDLENFDESPILQNDAIQHGCINCHSFQNRCPGLFSFQVRLRAAKMSPGMVLVRNGRAAWVNTGSPAAPGLPGYLSWDPAAPVAAFSMSAPSQIFRAAGPEIRDVFDSKSDLAAWNADTGMATSSPGIAAPDRLETFPGWSADGRFLYFSSAKTPWEARTTPTPDQVVQTRFDLMRAAYDAPTGAWGAPELVLSAAETGKSILEPRASPDGRYLLLCLTDYGGFPIHQPGADLYLLDLKSGRLRRLECNSDQADTWHCWSGNSRWIVFSSKRDNGLLARPYFCYIDAQGRAHKPFVLPQKDPAFYDSWLKTYNVPELVNGPVTVPPEELARVVLAGLSATNQASPAGQTQKPAPAMQ